MGRALRLDWRPPASAVPGTAGDVSALSKLDRVRLGAEIVATYGRARWNLKRSDLAVAVGKLRGAAPDGRWLEPGPSTHAQGARLARATTRTLAVMPADSRCLMQSLVLLGLLSRRGIGSILVVGVQSEPSFEAHAWVEHDGAALLPSGPFGRLVEL